MQKPFSYNPTPQANTNIVAQSLSHVRLFAIP